MRTAHWAHFGLHPPLARFSFLSSSFQIPCLCPLHLHSSSSSSSCAPPPTTSFLSFAPFLKIRSNTRNITFSPLSPPIITTGMASSSSSASSSWHCSRCTYFNPPTQKNLCEVCFSPSVPSPPRGWSCKACTFANALTNSTCEICGTKASPRSCGLDSVDAGDRADDLGASVDSVFLPLQRCKRKCHSEDEVVARDGGDEAVREELEQPSGWKVVRKPALSAIDAIIHYKILLLELLEIGLWSEFGFVLRFEEQSVTCYSEQDNGPVELARTIIDHLLTGCSDALRRNQICDWLYGRNVL
ncbi:hypothetical protein ACLOJK_029781 [Asimina triloba]